MSSLQASGFTSLTRRSVDPQRRDLVLGSGKVGVRAYCSVLLSSKAGGEEAAATGEATAPTASAD
jgi:hypothetical protein